MRHRRNRYRSPLAAVAVLGLVAACGSSIAGVAVPRTADKSVETTTSHTARTSATTSSTTTSMAKQPTPAKPSSSAADSTTPGATKPGATKPGAQGNVDDQLPDGAPGGIGATGIGDAYYPSAGNGGYDVQSYAIQITYDPATNGLTGSATISATSTAAAPLTRFDLDLQRTMTITSVKLDGVAPTDVKQAGAELIITPKTAIAPKAAFKLEVSYGGKPDLISGGTAGLGDGGWYRTRSGGALVAGEPSSASAWYPVNEHPADAASYAIDATVPTKFSVMSNGVEAPTRGTPPAGMHTVSWRQDVPIASYLVTLYIDTFETATAKLPDGTPVVSAFAPGDHDQSLHDLTVEAVPVLAKLFGPYPYQAAGGIFTGENLPFALETATRPVYADWVNPDTVIHELAHQWFGDHVRPRKWQDVCLNECFASYAPWLYDERTTDSDSDARFRQEFGYAGTPDSWSSPLFDMGAGNEFTAVYTRGPLALHVLRKEMGDKAFFQLLTTWTKRFGGRSATFDDLKKLAEDISGRDLDRVFAVWFVGTDVPGTDDVPESLR